MKYVWHCNWASVDDAECMRDDIHELDAEFLASPCGVILGDIADIQKVFDLIIADDRDLCSSEDEEANFEPGEFVLRTNTETLREYGYGEDTILLCYRKEVL